MDELMDIKFRFASMTVEMQWRTQFFHLSNLVMEVNWIVLNLQWDKVSPKLQHDKFTLD